MRIYKYSKRFRVPALDQSDCSICYSYNLIDNSIEFLGIAGVQSQSTITAVIVILPMGVMYCDCNHYTIIN